MEIASKPHIQRSSFYQFLECFLEILLFETSLKIISRRVLIRQILFTGVEALGLITILSIMLGTTVIHFGHTIFTTIGNTNWIYELLVSVVIRDIGPIIVTIILLMRSGISICTELGIMATHGETNYLKTLGINPINYFVIPRVIGMVLSGILLMIYFASFGLLGGYVLSSLMTSLDFSIFLKYLSDHLTLMDIFLMITKITLGSLVISLICCYHGLHVQYDITEIPKRNIQSVSQSLLVILAINIILIVLEIYGG